jgi:hypothetical protein
MTRKVEAAIPYFFYDKNKNIFLANYFFFINPYYFLLDISCI